LRPFNGGGSLCEGGVSSAGRATISETSQTVSIPEAGISALFGRLDENLRAIEDSFGVKLMARGTEISVVGSGPKVPLVQRMLAEFSELLKLGFPLQKTDVVTAITVLKQDPNASLTEFFSGDFLGSALRSVVAPRNVKQRQYLKTVSEHDVVFAIGPAGTGKTYLAVAMAAAALLERKIKRIVLCRPAVEAGERLGFLPGDLVEKINPYLRPLYDALYDILGYEKTGKMLERGVIEVAPIAFMRGRTLNDAFIILDEAQNTTTEQMKMFLTRIGFFSKAVITGDVTQVDLPQGKASGLREARRILSDVPEIGFVTFDERDVVRHPIVQRIVAAYESEERFRQADPTTVLR
jgi:phosphate starvation-inducible PhoH-like protein